MQKILYEDDNVRIDRDEITIIQYFFPIPLDKTIKMKDIQCVGLKYDIDNDKKYIEIIVKGFGSLNATFCPEDPNKVMAIVQTYSSLARSNLYANLTPKEKVQTQVKKQVFEPNKQNIEPRKQDIRSVELTAEDARKQNLQYENPSVISSVTHSIAHGWDVVKQSAHNIYEVTTQKIHEYTSGHQVQKKTQQARQNIKQGAQDIKEGTKEASKELKQGIQDSAENAKKATGYEGLHLQQAKQNIAQDAQNIKKGASNASENISKKLQGLSIQEKNKPYIYKTDQSLKEKSFNITG